MQSYDVFNGDADGICSLHQLRLKYPCESTLITGVKRDINLLAGVPSPPAAAQDWHITVLDISYDKNRNDVDRLLDHGAEIEYFDHHYAGTVPVHPRLHTHIDTAPDRGTSFIVDACLNGHFRAWAIAGTFGDNFDGTARRLAASLAMPEEETSMLKELGREPTPLEISERTGLPMEKILSILEASREPVSLETPVGDEDSTLGDFIENKEAVSPYETVKDRELTERIKSILATLSPREEKIIRLRFGIGEDSEYTLEEIGKRFNVSRERIRQIEKKALNRLRHSSRRDRLKYFLD